MSRRIKKTNTFYEIKLLEYLKTNDIINQKSQVLIIGSYLANHALYFSKILKCKWVHCFEPTLYLYKFLCNNLKINGVSTATCYPVAVDDKGGNISVFKFNLEANYYQYNDSDKVECVNIDFFEVEKLTF